MALDSTKTPAPADLAADTDGADPVATLEGPRPFGDYHLLGKIARGGMAEVYFGVRRDRPSEVLALKCMRPHLAKEERFVEMFTREGRLATMLQHPCIVESLDVGQAEGRYFIAMRYISGKDLTAVLRRCRQAGRRLPVPHAVHIALSICRALHYAHELTTPEGRALDVVNRDVSPSNVRLSFDGEVKLLDFGIAQAVMQVRSEIGILKGKFAYMSPEQIRGLPVDRRTDVFSTGIVLHEMLTCERLFREESEFVLMEKVRRTEIKPPSSHNKRVPAELDALVLKALQRDPAARFADAATMAVELEALLERYQFTGEELGEFTRSLFPADYRRERELLARIVSTEPKPKRKRKRKRRTRRLRRKAPREGEPGAEALEHLPDQEEVESRPARWIIPAALTLLAAAGLLIFLALR